MGRKSKDKKPEIPHKDSKLETILNDLRNDAESAVDLVEYLEGDSFKRDEHDIIFCKAYVLALIQANCKDTTEEAGNRKISGGAKDKIEIMLAAYGLLKGFEFKDDCLSVRMHSYYDHAHGYNCLIKGVWKGPSIDKMTRDILNDIAWELANTLHDLKTENGGNLGLIDKVPKELKLPSPRNFDEQNSPKPGKLSSWIKRVFDTIDGKTVRKIISSNYMTALLAILCLVLLIFLHMEQSAKNTSHPCFAYDYPSGDNTTLVEKIRCTQPLITVYPGVVTPLPIDVAPNEAMGAYLLCNSTDETILTGIDGVIARVKASEYFEPGTPFAKVSVVVKPLYPKSSDVFIEIPIEVDYTSTIPEPLD